MPWLQEAQDHCQSATDVREQCRHIISVRRRTRDEFSIPLKGGENRPIQKSKKGSSKPLVFPLSQAEKIESVVTFVCGYFNVPRHVVLNSSRDECLSPRYATCYLLRVVARLSFGDMARVINQGDTNTVSSYYKAEALLKTDENHEVSKALTVGLKRFGFVIDRWAPPAQDAQPAEPLDEPVLPPRAKISAIIRLVAAYYGIDPRMIVADKRDKEISLHRHVTMFLCCTCTTHSTPLIGRQINRDHTSVLHGFRRIEQLIKTDERLAADIEHLKDAIGGHDLAEVEPVPVPKTNKVIYGRRFTDEEVTRIRDMVWDGLSNKEIAKATGRTLFGIESKIRHLNLKRNPNLTKRGIYSEDEIFTLTAMLAEGASVKDIALAINRDPNSVSDKIFALKMGDRKRGQPFTAEQKATIREMWMAGKQCWEIAQAIGRLRSSVRDRIVMLERDRDTLLPNAPSLETGPESLHA